MTQEIVLRPNRRRRRRAPWLLLVLGLLLVSGWSWAWLEAQRQAVRSTDAWFAAEAARGRPWSCSDRDISGFPFSFTLSCAQSTFTARIGGEQVEGQVAGLRAEASLMHPNRIRVTLASPMTAHRGEDTDPLELSWSGLSIEIGLTLAAEARAAISADGLDIVRPDQRKAHIDHVGLQLATAGLSGSSRRDYQVSAQLAGTAIPELDGATGTATPMVLDGRATITGLELNGLEPWQDVVERWRLAGGRIELASLTYGKEPLRVAANGQLGLDELHRPTGLLQTTISGYETMAERLGLPLRAVSFGGALAGLLGGPTKPTAAAVNPGRSAMTLPVGFSGGRLTIGPFKTALRLAPLY